MNEEIEEISGNVFADLGHPNPYEALAKSRLAQGIAALVNKQALTQDKIAELLNVDQPTVYKLMRGQLREFSMDKLLRFLNTLNQEVKIVIREKPSARRQAVLSRTAF